MPETVGNSFIETPDLTINNSEPDLDGPGPEPPSYQAVDDDDDDIDGEPDEDPQETEDSAAADRQIEPDSNPQEGSRFFVFQSFFWLFLAVFGVFQSFWCFPVILTSTLT